MYSESNAESKAIQEVKVAIECFRVVRMNEYL